MRPSPERTMVAWAKANSPLAALVAGRVATRLPADPTFPFLTVRQIGGGPDGSDAPVDEPLLQWDCYGAATAQGKVDADQLARTLVDELETRNPEVVTGEGYVYGHQVLDQRSVEEPATGWARYMVTSIATIRALIGGA